jgi:uncharacterized protein
MKAGTRLDRVDALRALALLPVLLVNLGSFHGADGGPMLQPAPAGSASAWVLTWLASALLAGKGITLLNFLVGYGLTLGRKPEQRARRLLSVGLLHGFLLYWGDILTSYALAMLMGLRHRRARLRSLIRRGLFWLLSGLLVMVLTTAIPAGDPAEPGLFSSVAKAQGFWPWWTANAETFGLMLLSLPIILPSTYGLLLLGLTAGRLRLLSHRRWRPLWRRLARWALPLVGLNLLVALPGWTAGEPLLSMPISLLMGLLSVPAWAAWLLARDTPPPSWLAQAGRNTLSIYLAGSLLIVLLLSGAGMHGRPGTVAVQAVALLAWLGLVGLSAAAARAGRRLPLEAWMARP